MKVGIPRELDPLERRVAAVPRSVRQLREMGFEVMIEQSAGKGAEFTDDQYTEVGATVVTAETVWSDSDLVLKVKPPLLTEVDALREGGRILSFVQPADNSELLEHLSARKATVLAMDCVPRITRAQKMDALSAMAGVAGYRAVIEAAHAYPRYFAGQMTAAGRIDPAKILIIGGGVAGLAALGTARGLGAIVRAFDTRLAVKEQVQSLGGEFLELDFEESGEGEGGYAKVMSDSFLEAEMALFAQQAIEVDIIITTAIIPGREAPTLITAGMVESMKEGSVIVDVAAEKGGNCALTEPDKKIVHHGVSIIGYTDLVSRMSILSSRLYASTLVKMLEEMGGGENFTIDRENEVVRGALVMQDGEVTWPPPKREEAKPETPAYAKDFGSRPLPENEEEAARAKEAASNGVGKAAGILGAILLALVIGIWAPISFVEHFTVFVLACFVGWQLVWNVTPALHTPLMSVTNAISGIIILGGMLHLSTHANTAAIVFGAFAVFFATINIAGGFTVTRRMLAMFRK
ncbi:MAG: Re/Si-specific NAD(P)(+) transhydrogenase subunit alpha [Planctomycetota bacterium]|nr:Re/Si-specific NAD(P)(+) transhydrogenase subunit alpha [Planctomycetota bacterium]